MYYGTRAGYKASIKEQSEMLPKKEAEVLLKCQKKIIKCLDTEIDYIEIDIKTLITADTELKKQYELITTIKGVGAQTALNMIVLTEGFKKFSCWRKFASYCGTAPFPNTSGLGILLSDVSQLCLGYYQNSYILYSIIQQS